MIEIFIFVIFAIIIGLILAIAKQKFIVKDDYLVNKINTILPQTQCAQCNYPGCLPYAKAIASGEAAINLCPPGGQETVNELAELLGVETIELAAENTMSGDNTVAFIDENQCIGCTLCIKACPVDAIVGAPKVMTTIIASECTGCELCIAPCPVDCISMIEIKSTIDNYIPLVTK